jgi:hypothetical protein
MRNVVPFANLKNAAEFACDDLHRFLQSSAKQRARDSFTVDEEQSVAARYLSAHVYQS